MNSIQKRFILFLFLCIPARLIFVYLAKILNKENLKKLGFLLLIPAIGFLFIYITNSRSTGQEVFGNKIWWNNLRPFHGFAYLIFSIMAILGNSNAWIILASDVAIGLFAFLMYHYKNNNYKKLFI